MSQGSVGPVGEGAVIQGSSHTGAPTPRNEKGRRWRADPFVLLAPAALILGFVLVYPLVRLVINSFQDFGLRALFSGTTSWIGFENYAAVFTDSQFLPVLARTFAFTGVVVVAVIAIGMLLAQVMIGLSRAMRTVLNLVLILAWAIPTVTSTLVWQWLFQPSYGVVNWLITQLGVFGDFATHNWISTPMDAFFIVVLLILWQSVPFVALTLYASQSQVPAEYYEAAMLDGASAWRIYRAVTFPFLRPVLFLVTILSIIWHFNTFNQIWILTQGGPSGATTTLGIWSFQKAFAANSFGQGSAIALITGLLLMIVLSFYVRALVRSGESL